MVLLITSCAHRQETSSVTIPDHIRNRPVMDIFQKCLIYMDVFGDGASHKLRYVDANEANAFAKDNDVFLTKGIFDYDNEVLTFVIAHELAHIKLKHSEHRQLVSLSVTGTLLIVNYIVPGAGLLNPIVNPLLTKGYSREQECDADKLASQTIEKYFDISIDQQIQILQKLKSSGDTDGGLFSYHPSLDDRISNIKSR